MQARIILVALCITACSSTPIITKPQVVKVEVEKLIPIPREYFTACPGKPATLESAKLNGDLEWIIVGYETSFVPCLLERLETIRRLSQGSNHLPTASP